MNWNLLFSALKTLQSSFDRKERYFKQLCYTGV